MATKRFEKRFALKEATETFQALNEAFNPGVMVIDVYGEAIVDVCAQIETKEVKLQFIATAKTLVTKGVEITSYYHRAIRRHCISLKWRIE
ncbi:MAG: hypothetical protein UIG59_03060 [Acutalibacteraceae bacterium]|nr:hypothetical protein [Acutalibacteraceae bacterium]